MYIIIEEGCVEVVETIEKKGDHLLVTTTYHDIRMWPEHYGKHAPSHQSLEDLYGSVMSYLTGSDLILLESFEDHYERNKKAITKT